MPARRDLLRAFALSSAAVAAIEIVPSQSADAATSASAPQPSGDTSGVTDNANIQALLDSAAQAGGGVVTLAPAGQYTVTGLTIDTRVVLDLNASVLTLAAAANAPVVATAAFASLYGTDSTDGPMDFEIRNGYLDGNGAAQTTSTSPVLAIYGRRFVVDNLMVRNGSGAGIVTQWGLYSPFLAPNGFESFLTRLYIHSCAGDGLNFQGPHDTFVHTVYIARCSVSADAVPLRVPDVGRAAGANFAKFHIYGGQGYDYGLVANSGGVKFTNFIVEGAQVAQILIQAAQVKMDAFHLYSGNIASATVKGIQLGDAAHPGTNGTWLRGVIEGLGGGALDVTYCGDNNNIDLVHYVYAPIAGATSTDYGVTGTLRPLNVFDLDVIGPDYTKTAASEHSQHGLTSIHRTGADDTRDLHRLLDESARVLTRFDNFGRQSGQAGMGRPTVVLQPGAGSGASAHLSGTDAAGQIVISVGRSPRSAVLARVDFAHPWSGLVGAPRVILQPANLAAAALGPVSTEMPSAARFSIRPAHAPTAGASYVWDYQVIG